MKVSILMSFEYRPTLIRTLKGWKDLNWPDVEFLFCDNASSNPEIVEQLVHCVGLPISYYQRNNKFVPPQVNWNTLYSRCAGDFIIIAMQDEIISTKNIIQEMLATYALGDHERVSIIPYELTEQMTKDLDGIAWETNPKLIESLPGFWTDSACANTTRVDAGLLMHITGQMREDWDYFGLFRPDWGYLLLDRDIVLRERVLNKKVLTPTGVVSYHQWHIKGATDKEVGRKLLTGPSFTYRTEREARLLDPVEPD